VSMSPFVYMCAVGAFQIDPERWWRTEDDVNGEAEPIQWAPLLNNLFWNLNSFDSAASFSQDVGNAETVFVKGIFLSFFMIVLGYLLPLAVALGAVDSNRNDWENGYLTTVASKIGGPWLGAWVVLAAAVSNVGLFMAAFSADCFQLMGMAERGLLPRVFAMRSRFGTPTVAVLTGYVVISFLSFQDVTSLIEMMNVNYSLALLMEYAAFIQLRIKRNDVHRPFRIPLNTFGCILFLSPAVAILIIIILLMSKETYIFSTVSIGVGILLYGVQRRFGNMDCKVGDWFGGCVGVETATAVAAQYKSPEAPSIPVTFE